MKKLMIMFACMLFVLPVVFSSGISNGFAVDDSLANLKGKPSRNPNLELFSYIGYAFGYTRYTADYYRIGQAFSFRKGQTSKSAFGLAIELKVMNDFLHDGGVLPSILFDYRFYPLKTRVSPYFKANVGSMMGNNLDACGGFGLIVPLKDNKGIIFEMLVGTFYFGLIENKNDHYGSKERSASSASFNVGYKF